MPRKPIKDKAVKDVAASTTDLTEQAVKKVVKRKRPYKSDEMSVQAEPGDNRKYIMHSMRLYNLPKISMQSEDDVRQRIQEYFAICAEEDMKPSVAGLALALDIDRVYLWELRSGRKGQNPEIAEMLRKAVKLLDLQMVDYMQNGKINPVSGIFLMKNNFGYTDKQEVVLTPNNPLGDAEGQKQLADKYLDIVEIQDDEEG